MISGECLVSRATLGEGELSPVRCERGYENGFGSERIFWLLQTCMQHFFCCQYDLLYLNNTVLFVVLPYSRGRQRRSCSADVLQSLAPTMKKPHLPVALVILKTLISLFRCVWLGLELNSTGQRHSRTDAAYPLPYSIKLQKTDAAAAWVFLIQRLGRIDKCDIFCICFRTIGANGNAKIISVVVSVYHYDLHFWEPQKCEKVSLVCKIFPKMSYFVEIIQFVISNWTILWHREAPLFLCVEFKVIS